MNPPTDDHRSQRARASTLNDRSGRIVGYLALAPWMFAALVVLCITIVALFAPEQLEGVAHALEGVRPA
jgi:hypothetical protein